MALALVIKHQTIARSGNKSSVEFQDLAPNLAFFLVYESLQPRSGKEREKLGICGSRFGDNNERNCHANKKRPNPWVKVQPITSERCNSRSAARAATQTSIESRFRLKPRDLNHLQNELRNDRAGFIVIVHHCWPVNFSSGRRCDLPWLQSSQRP